MNKLIIADADILISLVYKSDVNHKIIDTIMKKLVGQEYIIKFPNTALLEAITALKRGLNKPDLSKLINTHYKQDYFGIIYVDDKIQKRASDIFENIVSKQDTIFDTIVIATAEIYNADAILSMDKLYKKYFALAQDII
ncbi:type II toxin-antitoxin system VapC family toxin [Patescibacteria group bacterium]|nr:type II toxin-antitoxin system VapC family toxin [Patescibacteria group bacterium]